MNEILVFTDGASRGNPGRGGWGAIVATEKEVVELGGREDHTTNNRMELLAVISSLEFVSSLSTHNSQLVTVHTDSSYVLKGATLWLSGWKRNGFKTKGKSDVLNRDLWERMENVIFGKNISWKLLPGHSGVPANERCDVIATEFADKMEPQLYVGDRDSYTVDLTVITATKTKVSKSKNKNIAAYSYVTMIDGKIETYKTWKECEAKVKGVSGVKFKKAVSLDDEKALISLWKKGSKR